MYIIYLFIIFHYLFIPTQEKDSVSQCIKDLKAMTPA